MGSLRVEAEPDSGRRKHVQASGRHTCLALVAQTASMKHFRIFGEKLVSPDGSCRLIAVENRSPYSVPGFSEAQKCP